jgi:putative transcriptional regulator
MPKAQISNRVRQLRFEHGEMTQQELATRVGCTRQTIIVLEKERYVPSLSLAFAIARVFGAAIEDVFEYLEES